MGSAVGAATRVLIVDDEEYQRAGLASMVSSWGFGAETAADGQEALDKLIGWPVPRPRNRPDDAAHGWFRAAEAARKPGQCASGHRSYGFREHRNRRRRRCTTSEHSGFWRSRSSRVALAPSAGTRRLPEPPRRGDRAPAAPAAPIRAFWSIWSGASPQMQQVFSLIQQVAPAKRRC